MIDIKRSILLKCETEEDIDRLFDNYGINVTRTLEKIRELTDGFQRVKALKAKCHECREEKTITYNKDNENYCTTCFMKQWSQFTLQGEFKQQLTTLEPKFAMSGYYYGAIITGISIFKSYLSKKELRDRQIENAKEQCLVIDGQLSRLTFDIKQTKAKIRQGKNLTQELNKMEKEKEHLLKDFKNNLRLAKRKPISFPTFRNNQIYFGATNMFEFKQEEGKYNLYISGWKAPKSKMLFNLRIGDLRKYHKKCKGEAEQNGELFKCEKCGLIPKIECHINFQEQFILKCIEKKQNKIVYPKLIRRQASKGYEYYFMFPTRDVSNVAITKEALEKKLKEKDLELCCISFGIKKPTTLIIIKNGKISAIKEFGNGIIYQRNELERKLRGDIFFELGLRYRHEHPHKEKDRQLHQHKRNALKKIGSKMGFRLRRFVNYYNQKLTHDIIHFIKTSKNPIIIFRDTKNIKDISYRGELMRTLSRWSIEQQKTFLTYKSYLNEIPVYLVPYKDTKTLKCWKCNADSREKVTTQILQFEAQFECESCKANCAFHVVDAFNLFMKLKEAKAL